MSWTFERVTEPEIEPVTLAEAKLHLRAFANVTDLDNEINELIQGAREWVEDYTGRVMVDSTFRLNINNDGIGFVGGDSVGGYLPGAFGQREWLHLISRGELQLRKAPIIEVLTFVSFDASGAETAIDPDTWALREQDSKWPKIVPINNILFNNTGMGGGLRVTFRAGFCDMTGSPQDDASVIPSRFKTAMKLWIEANYDRNKDNMELLLETAANIIKPERADLQIA